MGLHQLSAELDALTLEVYRFSAMIRADVGQLEALHSNDGQAAAGCSLYSRQAEIGTAHGLVAALQQFRRRIASIADGAVSRFRVEAAAAGKAAEEGKNSMIAMEKLGNTLGMHRPYHDAQAAFRAQNAAGINVIVVQRRSASMTDKLDTLVDEVNSDIALIQGKAPCRATRPEPIR